MLLLGETFSDGVPKGYLSSRLPRRSQKQHAFPQASQNVQVFRKMVGPNFLRVTCNLIQRKEGAGGAEGQGMPSSESDQMVIRNWGLCLLILWWSQQQRGSVISVLLVPVIAWVAQKMPHWGRTLVFGPFYDQFCHESLPVAYALMKFKCLIHAHTVSIYIIFNLKEREKRKGEHLPAWAAATWVQWAMGPLGHTRGNPVQGSSTASTATHLFAEGLRR